jgi:hypothetical protein
MGWIGDRCWVDFLRSDRFDVVIALRGERLQSGNVDLLFFDVY